MCFRTKIDMQVLNCELKDENMILDNNVPGTDEDDTSSEQHWSDFVEHLKGPIIYGNVGRSHQQRQDLGE